MPGSNPSFEQALLLRSALCQGDEALNSWQRWKQGVDLDSLDAGSARLLPLLYHNLNLNGLVDQMPERLSEEYVQTWCNNEILFHELRNLIRSFQANKIESLLLKGAPLALLYYKDLGLRPMSDVDVLVRPQNVLSAIEILHGAGWKSIYESPEDLITYQHAVQFTNGEGQRLDLHWRALWDGRQELRDQDFWESAVPFEIDDVLTHTLNPADQLLHVCVHGAAWNDLPSLRWVADAATIIRVAAREIDWDQLIQRTRARRLMLPMRDALAYLHGFPGVAVPTEVLETIRDMPATKLEYAFYRMRIGRNRRLRQFHVLYYWLCAWRRAHGLHYQQKSLEFLRYLRCFCGARLRSP